eukprot:TRINITY_DN2826_c0_g1_i2.p1 TRINITY_DN2826_c0_g1~~TRINITY_DN2826_c0_g1_i2.p1  ORF type:complete len:534 (-),score=138.80 TRINITY_DN2826_c0_g1_i2:108-1709(-)
MEDKQKRQSLEELCKRRFFFTPAYEIYGGIKGLYDYGPPGSAVVSNLTDCWKDWFILEESMLQIQTASLTPEVVFKVSGHVDKFEDNMVRDVVTGECYRADHLLEETLEELLKVTTDEAKKSEIAKVLSRVDDLTCKELGENLTKYNCKAPDTGNEISAPFPFNLMFSTHIGPTGKLKGYMRPETAQGMFVNFSRLLDFNGGRLPFAAAQIGPAFRNEISPRAGLLRVREFTLAEIEHFVDPEDKSHPKFESVKDHVLPLFSRKCQLESLGVASMSVGQAVSEGVINNETLGYFLVRVHKFLIRAGVKPDKVRFRQHLANEMAHYACDCWDAEIHTTYGWIECVGNADRACYDLSVHEKASGKNLKAFVPFPDGSREVEVTTAVLNKGLIGKTFKGDGKKIFDHFESIKDDYAKLNDIQKQYETSETVVIEGLALAKSMISFTKEKKQVTGRSVQPSVIEPSFGLGRIVYCLLEHAFWAREGDEQRVVLSLKPIVAPYKASVLSLVSDDKLVEKCSQIGKSTQQSMIMNDLCP